MNVCELYLYYEWTKQKNVRKKCYISPKFAVFSFLHLKNKNVNVTYHYSCYNNKKG